VGCARARTAGIDNLDQLGEAGTAYVARHLRHDEVADAAVEILDRFMHAAQDPPIALDL